MNKRPVCRKTKETLRKPLVPKTARAYVVSYQIRTDVPSHTKRYVFGLYTKLTIEPSVGVEPTSSPVEW